LEKAVVERVGLKAACSAKTVQGLAAVRMGSVGSFDWAAVDSALAAPVLGMGCKN
jgi:hypothetical protein